MTGPAHIRPAGREDVPALWALLLDLARYERLEHEVTGSAAALERHLFGTPALVRGLVAERDGALAGYALTFTTYSSFRTVPRLWLEDLYVRPAERGRGTGRALLAAVAAQARSLGCGRVSWQVLEWNAPAIGFYEAQGAEPDAGGWFTYHLNEAALAALAREAAG